MSLFGSKGPSPDEWARHAAIKQNLSMYFSAAVKRLQKQHVSSEEPVRSEDAANQVCCSLEAVFLHELKATMANKSFWGFLTQFTHKNVVSQLNRLGQITTEVGMCRAWVRLAMNDGVLESYIDAIMKDAPTIRYYYKRTAFLRDTEQVEILKSLTQGLSTFWFELSYNSSVLNIWSTTPLSLAGLVRGPLPKLTVTSVTKEEAKQKPQSKPESESSKPATVSVIGKRARSKSASSGTSTPSTSEPPSQYTRDSSADMTAAWVERQNSATEVLYTDVVHRNDGSCGHNRSSHVYSDGKYRTDRQQDQAMLTKTNVQINEQYTSLGSKGHSTKNLNKDHRNIGNDVIIAHQGAAVSSDISGNQADRKEIATVENSVTEKSISESLSQQPTKADVRISEKEDVTLSRDGLFGNKNLIKDGELQEQKRLNTGIRKLFPVNDGTSGNVRVPVSPLDMYGCSANQVEDEMEQDSYVSIEDAMQKDLQAALSSDAQSNASHKGNNTQKNNAVYQVDKNPFFATSAINNTSLNHGQGSNRSKVTDNKGYDETKNPFGMDGSKISPYDDKKNPFSDDTDNDQVKSSSDEYEVMKNPFASGRKEVSVGFEYDPTLNPFGDSPSPERTKNPFLSDSQDSSNDVNVVKDASGVADDRTTDHIPSLNNLHGGITALHIGPVDSLTSKSEVSEEISKNVNSDKDLIPCEGQTSSKSDYDSLVVNNVDIYSRQEAPMEQTVQSSDIYLRQGAPLEMAAPKVDEAKVNEKTKSASDILTVDSTNAFSDENDHQEDLYSYKDDNSGVSAELSSDLVSVDQLVQHRKVQAKTKMKVKLSNTGKTEGLTEPQGSVEKVTPIGGEMNDFINKQVADRNVQLSSNSEESSSGSVPPGGTAGPQGFRNRVKTTQVLQPSLSSATATIVERAQEGLTRDLSSDSLRELLDQLSGSEDPQVAPSGNGLGARGNSLGTLEGWSSSFDEERNRRRNRDPHIGSPASYHDLLHGYGASPVEARTMDQVLQELPDAPTTDSGGPYSVSPAEEATAEYEVLEFPPDLARNTEQLTSLVDQLITEGGLDWQNYQCKGCTRPIGIIYGKPRLCWYNGCYYCYECHENAEHMIPARVLHNWDFRKHKVSRECAEFLIGADDQPFLNIEKSNPRLYEHVPELQEVKELRVQLQHLKAYLYTCKQSVADELRRQVWPREYIYEDVDLYSVSDLVQVQSGVLSQTLRKVIKFAMKHIYDCSLCSQKGFICEICHSNKVIFPFENDTTVKCSTCKSVFHKTCKSEMTSCPRCERRTQRNTIIGEIGDYAFVPVTTS